MPAFVAAKTPQSHDHLYWIVTALFCLQMSFTPTRNCACRRWRKLHPPRLPRYFRVELSWAKLLGVVLMLAPCRAAQGVGYAGFAIDLASALIAHSRWAMARRRGAGRRPRRGFRLS